MGDILPSSESVGIILCSTSVGDDSNSGGCGFRATECDLRGKSGAQTRVSRKGQLGNAFEY